jgi:tripartite-type tricarboxylate transporter receptor subunit TctC
VIQLAKQKPNAMNYGSSGNGTSSHLAGELFNQMAGVRIVHVPYKATSTRAVDLASGMIELVFGNDLLPFARAGKVRILGVTSARRLSGYPEIPTVAEAGGLKNYEASVWYGLVAPAGTPAPIVEKLNAAIKKTLARPEVKQIVMTALGGDVVGNSPEQFASVIKTDLQKWDQVIKRARIIASD